VIDTLALARRKFPGAANSLDALCVRYGIDTSRRTKHGALLDAEILAEVYAELTGGRQAHLVFGEGAGVIGSGGTSLLAQRPHPLPSRLSPDDLSVTALLLQHSAGRLLERVFVSSSAGQERETGLRVHA